MSQEKDELIQAQNELIGVLFEIIKRFQANQILDDEYFNIEIYLYTISKYENYFNIEYNYEKIPISSYP